MDHRQLRCFVYAAETESFREAADKLQIVPSAVSRHIANLEADLGVRLFTRIGRHVRLTPAGERALVGARHVLETLDRFATEMRQEHAGSVGIVTLPGVAGILPRITERMAADHPEIEVRVSLAHYDRMQALILDGSIDLGIVGGAPDDPRFDRIDLFDADAFLISAIGKGPPGPVIGIEAALALPLVLPEGANHEQRLLERLARERGINFRASRQTDVHLMLTLVRHGQGHMIQPAHALEEFSKKDGFSAVRIDALPIGWSLIWRAGAPDSAARTTATAVIREEMARMRNAALVEASA